MKKIILLIGIIGILLINIVYASAVPPAKWCWKFSSTLYFGGTNNTIKDNITWLSYPLKERASCYINYNFGIVTYHNKSIGGSHYY